MSPCALTSGDFNDVQVYRDPGCTILKLLPIAEKYRSNQAALDFLQVRTYPKPEDLIVALEKVSPGIEDASECFKYLLKAGARMLH